MDRFALIYLVCCGVLCIQSAPTPQDETLYDAIIKKCPSVTSFPEYKNVSLFKTCSSWTTIKAVDALTSTNKNDVLCLLYYNAFTAYCSHSDHITTVSVDIPISYKLNNICDNLEILPKNINAEDNLHKIIPNYESCVKVCDDGFENVLPLCAISYYFLHFKIPATPIQNGDVVPESPKNKVNEAAAIQTHASSERALEDNTEKAGESANGTTSTQPKHMIKVPPGPGDKTSKEESKIVKQPAEQNEINKKETATSQNPTDSDTSPKNAEKAHTLNKPSTEEKIPDLLNINDQKELFDNPVPEKKHDDDDSINNEREPTEFAADEEPENEPVATNEKIPKPIQTDETEPVNFSTEMDGDSYFFTYFMLLCVICIVGYVCYHNKQKILALMLEGRRGKRPYRGKRPNSANYHKLDSNLEEAITSSCNKNTNNVIY